MCSLYSLKEVESTFQFLGVYPILVKSIENSALIEMSY